MASGGISRTSLGSGASHEGFLRHKDFRWLKIATGLSVLALLGYAMTDEKPHPSGGSATGYVLGTIGAVLILWLTMLGVRKRAMTRGRWSLKGWTSAHVYLGLSLAVIATLHSGLQFGWNVHTHAYALTIAVIVSGVYGTIAYVLLPSRLSDSHAAMTKSQMVDAVVKLDRQLQSAAQPLAQGEATIVRRALAEDPFQSGLGRRLWGHHRRSPTARALAAMRRRRGGATDSDAAAIEAVVQLLDRNCAALARIRRHLRIRALLEVWLYIHVPLAFALIAALTAHVISVFFYW